MTKDSKGQVGRVDVDPNPDKDSNAKVRIDLMDGSTDNSLDKFSKHFENKENEKKSSMFENVTSEQLKEKIKKEESEPLKPSDLEMFAEFVIELYEMALMAGCSAITRGDAAESTFALTVKKKEILVRQLTLILVKYQSRFRIELLFLATLAVASYKPINDARKIRNNRNKVTKSDEDVRSADPNIKVTDNDETINNKEGKAAFKPDFTGSQKKTETEKKVRVDVSRSRGSQTAKSVKHRKVVVVEGGQSITIGPSGATSNATDADYKVIE